jgi:hypothetical protein
MRPGGRPPWNRSVEEGESTQTCTATYIAVRGTERLREYPAMGMLLGEQMVSPGRLCYSAVRKSSENTAWFIVHQCRGPWAGGACPYSGFAPLS